MIAAGAALVSFPAGLLLTTLNAVMSRDESHRAVYATWSKKALSGNEKLKPGELSQEFCRWWDEETRKDREQTVKQILDVLEKIGNNMGRMPIGP